MTVIIPESVGNLWNKWNLRLLVLCSLCLQTVLVVFGSRRKYSAKTWIRIVIWTAYLSADWVATVALGMISSFQLDDQESSPHPNSHTIMAFWAPFLLVHLGGPDTITAYALEDNELWLRHLLGLVVQVEVAFFIFLRYWTPSTYPLSLLAIPVFVAGLNKYGERTWALRSASIGRLRDSLLPAPNPGRGYANYAAEYSAIKARGDEVAIGSTGGEGIFRVGRINPVISEARYLHEAFELFDLFKRLYADLILDYNDRNCCSEMLQGHSPKEVLKVIEVELGFVYDVLYTKATVVYSRPGIIFRFINLLCSISTLVVFALVIDKHFYSTVDITLTYLLSAGAIALELYAIIVLICTDWTLYWLSKQTHSLASRVYQAWATTKIENPPKCARILKLVHIYGLLEKYWYTAKEDVPTEMRELIVAQLQDAQRENVATSEVLDWRGTHALQKSNCIEKFGWSVEEASLDQSILLWHIATDLCFNNDLENKNQEPSLISSKSKVSKLFSNYMMHILVFSPFMLPEGIGQIRFRDTCAEATEFFEKRREVLLEVNTELVPAMVIGDRSKTVLFDGCRLAKQLMALETEEGKSNEEKWGIISQVWIEMLCYAASHCSWKEHAQQLRHGGELLTHVCLLMANLGFSQQFQIKQGTPTITLSAISKQP
ncbi:hypothetical protein D8674_006692 [Pyrus ussuriensis x Pyrus communis]|uniref:DUF4220 domain-containing protein n=1 Tax=Pyrus ussuriensis x Pyrus communis TaxID=2448454 RepID=A0A5N5FV02_9ROSA|nr:hypothetical protein D8674_006692 [Pyrus ussuriensis x Pyrus communis]